MILGKNEQKWKDLSGIFTATEICQQPATWEQTISQIKNEKTAIHKFLQHVLQHDDYDIILTGAGTSEFVGNSLYSHLNKSLNYKVKSYGTTDIVASPKNYLSETKPTLLISFGRSGNSPESVAAVEVADVVCQDNVYHLFITCNQDGALAKSVVTKKNAYDINLAPETNDKGFAMTSSFSNMYLAALLCFHLDEIDAYEAAMQDIQLGVRHLLENKYQDIEKMIQEYRFDRIVYLGADVLNGIAQESQLKLLELTAGKVATMYDTPMGFRHGPKSILNDQTLTVVYVSDDPYTRQYDLDLIDEISAQRKGNKIVAITNQKDAEVEKLVDYYYSLDCQMKHDNVILGIGYVVFAQVLAIFKSLSYDITPDNPCPSGEVNRVVKGVHIHSYK